MADYVKLCPRCGHRNDELASTCEKDGEFLGMVPAIPWRTAPPAMAEPSTVSEPNKDEKDGIRSEVSTTEGGVVNGRQITLTPVSAPGKALYLDVEAAGQCYPVTNGWTVGQSHPSNTAEIQLANLPGINFVHRRHCVFEFVDNQWRAKPLPQPDYTNPTFLNEKRLNPGQSSPLQNGDKLRFASITLRVRIVDL